MKRPAPALDIRPADAAVLAALHAACDAEPWPAADMARMLAMPGAIGLLACTADRAAEATPIGFVLARVAADECEIINFAVLPAARRRGVGRRLLRALMAEAAERDAARILLEVAVDNPAATALYHECGFAAIGARHGYYRRGDGSRVDALIMGRCLD